MATSAAAKHPDRPLRPFRPDPRTFWTIWTQGCRGEHPDDFRPASRTTNVTFARPPRLRGRSPRSGGSHDSALQVPVGDGSGRGGARRPTGTSQSRRADQLIRDQWDVDRRPCRGGEAINDLVATTVPIRRPAPSGFPCPKGSDCTIVIGFTTALLAAGVDRTRADAAFALERFDANGRLDSSFGTGGKVRTPFEAGQASAAGLAVVLGTRELRVDPADRGRRDRRQGQRRQRLRADALHHGRRDRPDVRHAERRGDNHVAAAVQHRGQPRCHAQRHPGRSEGSHRRGRRHGGVRRLPRPGGRPVRRQGRTQRQLQQ